jgi:hypothetical protein
MQYDELNTDQDKIQFNNDMSAYKIKISNNILLINDIIKENIKNKEIFENQIKLLTETYESNLLSNNNKIEKLTKYNETIKNMIDLNQQILEMECEDETLSHLNNLTLHDVDANNIYECKPVREELSILNVMKKVYTKQKENACLSETIVANNDIINAITKTSFSSWYYNSHYYANNYENAIKLEIDSRDYDATYKREENDTRYSNVYILTIKYPDNFSKLTNNTIIKFNNNELKDIDNEKYRETIKYIEILISKLILIKINRCNPVLRGRKPKVSE